MKTTWACVFSSLFIGVPALHAGPFILSQTFNDPTVTTGDRFGSAVSIDGDYVVVGARLDDTLGTDVGQVHLFSASTGTLLQTFNDPSVTPGDWFGISVAVEGNNVLVGASRDGTNGIQAGQAHLFDATTGALLQTFNDPTPAIIENFGWSVAISGDNVLVGSILGGTGEAHLFSATTGALLQTFSDPTATGSDNFGSSVAIDGDNVLIGASQDNTNGSNVGQAHLFSATTGALLQTFNDPNVTTGDQFGISVDIDGNNVLIGAALDDSNGANVGQAFLFDGSTGALLQSFDDPTVTSGDFFGRSVMIEGDNVVIGAPGDNTNGSNVGQSHLFSATTGALLHTFNDPTITFGDSFGTSVAISGNNILIGASNDDSLGSDIGQAYLFTMDATGVPEPSTWALLTLAGIGFGGYQVRRKQRTTIL